ncbi:MAG: hypothetical protein Q9225_005553 [Loekoesia sp. 1 TL-2023]
MDFEESVREKIRQCAAAIRELNGCGSALLPPRDEESTEKHLQQPAVPATKPIHGKVRSKVSLKGKEEESLLEKILRHRAALGNETATEAAAPFPFFQLPPELRCRVYNEIAANDTDTFDSKSAERVAQAGSDITNLMMVSRRIREEARTTSFLRNHFIMTVNQVEVGFLSDTIRCDELCWFTLPPLSKAIRNWVIEVTFCSPSGVDIVWNPSAALMSTSTNFRATLRRTFSWVCDQLSHTSVGIQDITIQMRCSCETEWEIRRCVSVSREREEHLASCIRMVASRVPIHGNFKIVGIEHLPHTDEWWKQPGYRKNLLGSLITCAMEKDWTELAMRAKLYRNYSKGLRDRVYDLWQWIDDVARYEFEKQMEKHLLDLELRPDDWPLLF